MSDENTPLSRTLAEIIRLDQAIDEINDELATAKEARDNAEQLALELMGAAGIQSVKMGGRTLYRQRELGVNVPAASRDALCEYMVGAGHEDLIETNVATAKLKSLIREMLNDNPEAELSAVVPAEILSLARVHEFYKLRNRKA